MGDQVSQEVQTNILQAVRQAHVNNLKRQRVWDSNIRSHCSAGLGLINDGVESYRRYGQIQTTLDVHQQSIVRRQGPSKTSLLLPLHFQAKGSILRGDYCQS